MSGEVEKLIGGTLVAEFVEAKRRGELPDAKSVREWFDKREPMTAAEADQRRNLHIFPSPENRNRISRAAEDV